jgi:hypothetical protein
MRVLFDHNVPSGAARAFVAHEVTEAIQRGWERVSNGALLVNAEEAGFDVLLTADKRIRYQQNLKGRRIALVVISNPTWRVLRKYLDRVTAAVNAATPGSYAEVEIPFK